MRDVNDDERVGWWVPADDWFKQRIWSVTGCWQLVRLANGDQLMACILSGREGWWNGNYEPINDVVEWLKPSKWFAGPHDQVGKVAEWSEYRDAALSNRSLLRSGA